MSPKPLRLTRPEPAEAAVLEAVCGALAYHPLVAWHQRFNTGAGRLVNKAGESQWMRFGFPGCSDVLGQLKDGRFLAVECKRPSGRLTGDQHAFLTLVRKYGGVAICARSADDVMRGIERLPRPDVDERNRNRREELAAGFDSRWPGE
jgi:hypothetical protein